MADANEREESPRRRGSTVYRIYTVSLESRPPPGVRSGSLRDILYTAYRSALARAASRSRSPETRDSRPGPGSGSGVSSRACGAAKTAWGSWGFFKI